MTIQIKDIIQLKGGYMLNLVFRGSGTKIVDSNLSVTHEMPEVYVEAESVQEGYEIARFKYHDIGYNIVHSIRCLNASRVKKVE